MRQLEEDLQSVGEMLRICSPKKLSVETCEVSRNDPESETYLFLFASIILERLFRMGLSLTINGVTCFLITGKVP